MWSCQNVILNAAPKRFPAVSAHLPGLDRDQDVCQWVASGTGEGVATDSLWKCVESAAELRLLTSHTIVPEAQGKGVRKIKALIKSGLFSPDKGCGYPLTLSSEQPVRACFWHATPTTLQCHLHPGVQ